MGPLLFATWKSPSCGSASNFPTDAMASRRGLVVLAVVLVITAACNGSSSQREALLRLNAGNGATGFRRRHHTWGQAR